MAILKRATIMLVAICFIFNSTYVHCGDTTLTAPVLQSDPYASNVPASTSEETQAKAETTRSAVELMNALSSEQTLPNQPPVATSFAAPAFNEDTASTIQLQGSDPDSTNLTYAIVDQPLHGTLLIDSTDPTGKTYIYTPTANYNGADSFTYTVSDGTVDSEIATVNLTINAVNDAPTVNAITTKNITQGGSVSFTLSASDADGDTLIYSAQDLPTGATFNASTKKFSWTPTISQVGVYHVTFTVDDQHGGLSTKTADIVVRDPASPYMTFTVKQDGTGNFVMIQNAIDATLAGDIVIVSDGVYHESVIIKKNGTVDKPITIMAGGDNVVIDGSDALTGWRLCTSAEECGGNPNWQNIYVMTVSSLPGFMDAEIALSINPFQGDRPLTMAQSPDSTNPLYQVMDNYLSVPSSSVTATSLTDPRLAALGGSALVGSYIYLYVGSNGDNEIVPRKILSFDPTTSKITFDSAYTYTNQDTKYAIANSILGTVFNKPGQYYFNETPEPDGTYKMYVLPYDNADLTDSDAITISTKSVGMLLSSCNYVTVEGFKIRRQTGDSRATAGSEGSAIRLNGSLATGIIIRNNEISGIYSRGDNNKTYYGAITTYDTDGLIIEDNYIHDIRGWTRGIQISGTNAVIENNRLERVSRTPISLNGVTNGSVVGNFVTDCLGVHSNGISVYSSSNNVLIAGNTVINSNIAMTTQNSGNLTIVNNIFDSTYNRTDGYYRINSNPCDNDMVIASWGGMFGTNSIINNIIMGSLRHMALYWYASNDQAGTQYVLKNNIIDGGIMFDASVNVDRASNIYTDTTETQRRFAGWSLRTGEMVESNISELFLSYVGRDYEIPAASPAIDGGANLSAYFASRPELCFDINGIARPVTGPWEIGAHEYIMPNQPPIAAPFTAPALNEDTASTIQLQGSDPDSTNLTYAIVDQPLHGTLLIDSTDPTGKTYIYTPTANYNGADSFTYTVSDGALITDPITVTLSVTAVNDAPVATSGLSGAGNEDANIAGQLAAVDIDGDALTYFLVSQALHGVVTVNQNGSYVYIPAANYNGVDSFTFKAYDGTAYSQPVSVSLNISAVNDPPTLAAVSNQTGTVNQQIKFALSATDIDSSTIFYQAVAALPQGAALDPSTGVFTWTPTAAQNTSVQFRSYDGQAYSNVITVVFAISQPYLPPAVSAVTASSADVDLVAAGYQVYTGTKITYTATATSESTSLTWQWYYIVDGKTYLYSSGTGANASVSFTYSAKSAGKTYQWYVVYSDGKSSTMSSKLSQSIITKPTAKK